MALPLLDALVRLDSPAVSHIISLHVISPKESATSEELVLRALFHLGTGALQPSRWMKLYSCKFVVYWLFSLLPILPPPPSPPLSTCILYYITQIQLIFQSHSEVVEAILALTAVTGKEAVYHQALLTLGTVAKQLQAHEPDLYADIVSMLHLLLEHHTGMCVNGLGV